MAKKRREKENLKTLSMPELEARLREAEETRFRFQFRHAGAPLKNPMQIRFVRREIARLKTWIHQKGAQAS
ncbi:MAG: 50S ribosomal protein L29 [Elusimicrobia bacterium RIFCSPLOWO2_01_FULL_59_12]|nr:MAG: 50S ribosomal protein L29 [Elusimicrobia bacterium RIFCSPLOWO2_01_FULL_59_12]